METPVPTVADFQFSDCVPAAKWLAATYQMEAGYDAGADEYPVGLALGYLRSLLHGGPYANATDGQLLAWWKTISRSWGTVGERDKPFARVWEFPYDSCPVDVCKNMGFEGDPDLSGIGITVSFWLAAWLSTAYFFAVVGDKVLLSMEGRMPNTGRREPGRQYPPVARASVRLRLYGFLESLGTFLESALIFAIAMLGAVIARYLLLDREFGVSARQYEIVTAGFMAHFSVLVPILLESISDALRRTRLRLLLWFVILALFSGFTNFVRHMERRLLSVDVNLLHPAHPWIRGFYWWNNCHDIRFYDNILRKTADAGAIIIFINAGWYLYALLYQIPFFEKRFDRIGRWRFFQRLKPYKSHFRLLNAFVCGVFIWLFLGIFHIYREDVLRRAGETNKDAVWTFGQVMALATWLPVVFDLVHLLIRGPERALGAKVSTRYKVIPYDRPTDSPQEHGHALTALAEGGAAQATSVPVAAQVP
ncbi:hypothetical protein, variant [Magnaporthiopsis poae ATCC 64411]|uniref:Uncharacterized protein n=1 Tax=Magnaporthiopsis poae (strain ATCC 64411 / 73-15) TaxID=644358 RepID=A0A0C4DWV5_MAGP6|nr:hypothetical protein, variant [Magnaporthiopsis poae ATCC 64411]